MVNKVVRSIEGHAAGRDVIVSRVPTTNISTGAGGTNIVGNHGPVHVQIATASVKRPRMVVQPNPDLHISQEQQITLLDLRNEWIALHVKIKKKPLTYAAAQSRINRAAGATTYSLILKERYDDAIRYVKTQMAMLRNMKSAPHKDDGWRAKRIGAIKVRCKNQLGDPDLYRPYIRKNFKASSLTELSTDQLQQTYQYVWGKKAPGS